MRFIDQILLQLNIEKRRWRRTVCILTVLSLLVALATVWNLRLTGITIANDATCGREEHQHTETCYGTEVPCEQEEHIHDISCYSLTTEDVETAEIWEATLPTLTGDKGEDIVLIAQSQLGYKESELNYEMAEDGLTKCGITRYGQWYGNPYGNWANMFTSFCLKYAGLSDVPVNAGAEAMRNGWEEKDLYRGAGTYEPVAGDIVFLDKNQNGTVDTTAIIVGIDNQIIEVIEGDVEDTVSKLTYDQEDTVVIGFGVSEPKSRVMMFAAAPAAAGDLTLWLDGTNGNIMSYRGSDNTKYTVASNTKATLPSQWKSPTKYEYKLAGWVNIKTGEYYLPGSEIVITENTVLYADWVASTYDIGKYNSYVADTISTKNFITTKVFDYSSLINLLSSKVSVNVSENSHSETWSHVSSGKVSYKNQETLNFSFNDHDSSGTITNLNNLNNPNKYTGGNGVYEGIHNETLDSALFSTDNLFNPETGTGIIGKHYLGEGDHLFQINTDPTSEHYGYYYYDAKLNAASYNQTDQRFYVYDYLARTSDSANNNDEGKYSDFLPLNSPYANTNGQTIKTYNYGGDNGEYAGVSHYVYDARYDSDSSASNQIKANLWFGMRVDVQFGLPYVPGTKLSNGTYGNRDIYGNDMHFKFTGDDDVWILVDGKVVLDLGGIHQAAAGDINFSTGEIRVNGKSTGVLSGVGSGEHTLSILYLERGSSMSNCAIYFNLAPRFSLTLQKEDVLTQEILNGAQFEFYSDIACTEACELWPSEQAYKNGEAPTNVFTVKNGQAYVWGLNPSQTYYIREARPPDKPNYDSASGIICFTLDKNGIASHIVDIVEGTDKNGNKIPISHGFTLHNFRIDEENQAAYIVITNAQNWVKETTSVYVEKRWNDNEDHTYDEVTAYLNVTDPNGTVRRIREIVLNETNGWKYTWTNLPKYAVDSNTMTESDVPIAYSVSEAYVPGYSPKIEKLENGSYIKEVWTESIEFENGKTYVLKTQNGCLSAVSATGDKLCLVEESVAKESPLALWTATVSNGRVKLTNQNGQSINYYTSGATRRFNVSTGNSSSQNLYMTATMSGIQLSYKSGIRTYYLCSINNNGYAAAETRANSALVVQLMTKSTQNVTIQLDGYGYAITNTPLTTETSLKVVKHWMHPTGDTSIYEKEQVTLKLLANGVDTGRTETLNLKNGWTVHFTGLPYLDDAGEPISYTVVESWDSSDWVPSYGPILLIDSEQPTYETTVTNVYRWNGIVELPATGGIGHFIYILCGLVLVLVPFVYGFRLRRKHERRSKR